MEVSKDILINSFIKNLESKEITNPEPFDAIFLTSNDKENETLDKENFEFDEVEDNQLIQSKNSRKGVSYYEYKGASYTEYRKNDEVKSEFNYPLGFNKKEFFELLDNFLKEIKISPSNKNKTTDKKINLDNNSLGINGKIDENVIQGSTGDCWIISALVSLSSTETGRAAIKNAIKVNSDNSVTITFKGVGKSYKISASELKKYDTDFNTTDAYSNGDNDVLAFELATEKLWQDIAKGKVKVNTTNSTDREIDKSKGITNGGLPSQFIYYLTGKNSKEYYKNSKKGFIESLSQTTIYQVLTDALKNKNSVLNFGVYNNVHTGTLTNGTTYTLNVGNGGHALSITKVTANTVQFVNPWNTSKTYEMSWKEFANFGIGYISAQKA